MIESAAYRPVVKSATAGPGLAGIPGYPVTAHEPARVERVVRHDAITGDATLDWVMDSGCHRYDDIDLTVHTVAADRFTIRPDDPLSARAEVAWTVRLERGDWRVETRTRTVLTATRDTFELVATLEQGEHVADVVGWQVPPAGGRIVGNFTHAGDATAVVGSAG